MIVSWIYFSWNSIYYDYYGDWNWKVIVLQVAPFHIWYNISFFFQNNANMELTWEICNIHIFGNNANLGSRSNIHIFQNDAYLEPRREISNIHIYSAAFWFGDI